jgi:two-component system, NtrC family, sensor histidine kinase HydH
MVETTEKPLETPAGLDDLARTLSAGVLLLKPDGGLAAADERALALLGCRERGELARRWEEIRPSLAAAEPGTETLLLPVGPEGRAVLFEVHRPGALQAEGGGAGNGVLLVRDPETLADAAADFRLASYFRVLSQVSPAVAHDLRAPINAMVFNIEILKETIAGARALEPATRERQLRYVSVLRDELTRLHSGLEHFLSHTSGRGDRAEGVDLREMVQELAALLVPQARKLQVQVVPELPDHPVTISGNRFQLRQALLEIGLAALSGVARAGTLGLRLESDERRARILLGGPPSPEAPALDFALTLGTAPAGCARLYPARAILAEQGGRVTVGTGALGERSFEVELPISGKE